MFIEITLTRFTQFCTFYVVVSQQIESKELLIMIGWTACQNLQYHSHLGKLFSCNNIHSIWVPMDEVGHENVYVGKYSKIFNCSWPCFMHVAEYMPLSTFSIEYIQLDLILASTILLNTHSCKYYFHLIITIIQSDYPCKQSDRDKGSL
jgi:hypothetical protein